MPTQPLVTVVLSIYKEELLYVQQCIESIACQTFNNFECVIIVDNPSNKSVVEYLEKFIHQDTRFSFDVHEFSQGLAVCRNQSIAVAKGEYIALMDADDIMKSNRLESQLLSIQQRQLDGVFSHVEYIDEAGDGMNFFTPAPIIKMPDDILKRHLFVHPTGFFKSQVLKENKYSEHLLRSQDLDLWLRLVKKNYLLGIITEVLLQYRLYPHASFQDRIKRQRGYAKYGFLVALHQYKNYWHTLSYYFFLGKRAGYFFVTQLPIPVLTLLLKRKKTKRIRE